MPLYLSSCTAAFCGKRSCVGSILGRDLEHLPHGDRLSFVSQRYPCQLARLIEWLHAYDAFALELRNDGLALPHKLWPLHYPFAGLFVDHADEFLKIKAQAYSYGDLGRRHVNVHDRSVSGRNDVLDVHDHDFCNEGLRNLDGLLRVAYDKADRNFVLLDPLQLQLDIIAGDRLLDF